MADLARLVLPSAGDAADLYVRGSWDSVRADGVRVRPGQSLSLGTWLNAAPAGWWAEILGPIELRLTVKGSGSCRVVRSSGGRAASSAPVDVNGRATFALPCDGSVEWYWLEWGGQADGGLLESARWHSIDLPGAGAPATVVIPTFRREADCLAQVRHLLTADGDTVGHMVVVDQGGTFAAYCRDHGWEPDSEPRVLLVEQENWGGSGGYGRGMRESLAWPGSPVFLFDDDARIEIETLRRLVVLSNHALRPTLLGTALFAAEDPTKLQALSEGVNRRIFQWGPNDGVTPGTDPTESDPSGWRFTRPSDRADYAGWWGALLPAGMVAELGEPAPYFLKWDDAEYGLRAQAAGYDARTVPTSAVWHPSWAAKGTIASWDAWPLHRNRLETARRYGAGRGVVLDSFAHQVKHVLSLQYDTAELWNAAIDEFLGGPGWMDDPPGAVRARAVGLLERCTSRDAACLEGVEPLADASDVANGLAEVGVYPPKLLPGGVVGFMERPLLAMTGLVRGNRSAPRAMVRLPARAFHWTKTLGADVAVLEAIDGTPGSVLVRDPKRARMLLAHSARLHARLLGHWCRRF